MGAHGDHDMGHTIAGWTGTTLAITASAVLGAGTIAVSPPLLVLGSGMLVAALVATWVLHLAGWGKSGGPRAPGARHWRTRDAAARRGHPGCLGCRLAGRVPTVPAREALDRSAHPSAHPSAERPAVVQRAHSGRPPEAVPESGR